MKCPWCQSELVLPPDEDFPVYGENKLTEYHCPNDHCEITVNLMEKKVYKYHFFHDIGPNRYKVQGWEHISEKQNTGPKTVLLKKGRKQVQNQNGRGFSYVTYYDLMIEVKTFLTPKLVEDTFQVEPIFEKLKKLVIFT